MKLWMRDGSALSSHTARVGFGKLRKRSFIITINIFEFNSDGSFFSFCFCFYFIAETVLDKEILYDLN
jgi:hypothetical protein